MSSRQSRLQTIPIHPLFFAAYPILALLAFNATELNVPNGFRSLLVSAILALLLLLAFRWIYHDAKLGALAASALLILFFSYGHIYDQSIGITVFGKHPFQHRTLIPLWVVLGILVLWGASRRPKN